jgi:hypothetical protein
VKKPASAANAFDSVVAAFACDPRVDLPQPTRGAFGSNGLKVNGRIFAMRVGDALVLKLPHKRVDEMIRTGAGEPFTAGRGRIMREWVMVRALAEWTELAREARRFVGAAPR